MKHPTHLTKAGQILLTVLLLHGAAQTGTFAEADPTIITQSIDAGGRRSTSAAYTHDGSMGGIVGLSTVASPSETMKHGYIGQLYEVTGLALTAASPTVNESGGTDQLAAWEALDDATLLAVPATSVVWSVLNSGPLSINANGLATAAAVYQDTVATAQGVYEGNTGMLDITVLDSIADNFGSYASDGIDDDWQVDHFGPNDHPDAGPLLDPDGDGDNNLYEFHARLIPTDPDSFLDITLSPDASAGEALLTLWPGKVGVTYTIDYKDSLLDSDWTTLTAIVGADALLDYTDTDAEGLRKFYRVTPQRTP